MRKVAILGSTGSIGNQALDVAARFPDEVRIVGLAANQSVARLREQVDRYEPKYAAIMRSDIDPGEGVQTGVDAIIDMVTAPDVDLVVVAIVGAGGLLPTLSALEAGKLVALANKETLVMAGSMIKDRLRRAGELVPIDSEHSAIWQCLQGEPQNAIEKVVLTASGGAFRNLTREELETVTPDQALRHPTWRMGPKITVDSATLMNKGLEIIEATLLFDVTMEDVEVIMHAESIVHSLVYFADSSVKAQLSLPDMRLPIEYALSYPDRWANTLERLDLTRLGQLHFGSVDWDRYPCLRIAVEAGRLGGTYPAALCAADEVAVELFLTGHIGFLDIPALIERTLDRHVSCPHPSLDDILQADATARERCLDFARVGRV